MLFFLMACSHKKLDESPLQPPSNTILKHLYELSSDNYQGRKVGSLGNKRAQEYLINALSQYGVAPLAKSYQQAFSLNGNLTDVTGHNIVGIIPGTRYPNRYIVLSAHYDHIGKVGRSIYNGADDNASGTAALLHFAQTLQHKPLAHSVILLFSDGEEVNLTGAKAFVKAYPELMSQVKLNINIDMIAGSKRTKKLHYLAHDLDDLLNTEALSAFAQLKKQASVKIKKGFWGKAQRRSQRIKWQLASDHGVFYRQNIPFIYYGVGTHKNYHETSDTYQNTNHQFFLGAVATIEQHINFFDQNL